MFNKETPRQRDVDEACKIYHTPPLRGVSQNFTPCEPGNSRQNTTTQPQPDNERRMESAKLVECWSLTPQSRPAGCNLDSAHCVGPPPLWGSCQVAEVTRARISSTTSLHQILAMVSTSHESQIHGWLPICLCGTNAPPNGASARGQSSCTVGMVLEHVSSTRLRHFGPRNKHDLTRQGNGQPNVIKN